MITVGNDKFPDEAEWLKTSKGVTKPARSYIPPTYSWDEDSSDNDSGKDLESDEEPYVGKQSSAPPKELPEREMKMNAALTEYMKKEWDRFQRELHNSLGEMPLSSKMQSQLRMQFGFSDDDSKQPVKVRLNRIFPNSGSGDPSSVDPGIVAANAGEYEAKPMHPDVASAKLASGKFSCMNELAWVIYNAGGHRAGGSYTSADNEKKLTTRPDFSPNTEKVRKGYVEQLDMGAKEVDLRHIISSTTLNKALANSNDSLNDVNKFLSDRGGIEQNAIIPAKIEAYKMVHSHLGNLWPGGAPDNQAAGTMHGKLNYEARKQGARMRPAHGSTDTSDQAPNAPPKKAPPPISRDEAVSDCLVNRFLTEVGRLDDDIAKKLHPHLIAGNEASITKVNECANLVQDLNDKIRRKVGAGAGGYTVDAMEADLNEWLDENPALTDGSLKAEILTDLRNLCQKEAQALGVLKAVDSENATQRVDECDLTTHLEKLRARGEISKVEQGFLNSMKAEQGVITARQEKQKAMATACVDYLQARSVAYDKLQDDKGKRGYTHKDLVRDLETLAANFDFDLAESLLDEQKIETTSPEYMTKLIDVELALLEAKAETGVSLFTKREGGKPSVMDQFMDLDYRLSEKLEEALDMVDDAEEDVDVDSKKPRYKRGWGDGRTHDEIRENKEVIKTKSVDRPDAAKKQKLSNSDGAGEDDLIGNGPIPGSVSEVGEIAKCKGNPIKSLADMKQKMAADKKAQGTDKMKMTKPG